MPTGSTQKKILKALDQRSMTWSELVEAVEIPSGRLMKSFDSLVLKRLVERSPSGRYRTANTPVDTVDQLTARIQELTEALMPFAHYGAQVIAKHDGDGDNKPDTRITDAIGISTRTVLYLGDWRRAAKFIQKPKR